jgi:rfaE bifunctional protein kinase chain/domain
MQDISISRVKELLVQTLGKKIAVIGDVMLDRYFWGSVTRVSPEAPVPVIDYENETYHLGGAANVASNLKSLGCKPMLCGVLGSDNSGKLFREIAEKSGIDCSGLYEDETRPTTVKTRIIGNNQQIARLDREVRNDITTNIEKHIITTLNQTEDLAGIIIEDYNKGTTTDFLIAETIAFARQSGVPVFVDPKIEHFFSFNHVTVIKPNKKEAEAALETSIKTYDDAVQSGSEILSRLSADCVLLTLGAEGMVLIESNGDVSSVPTKARMVADVSGAGDTAIATLSAMLVAGATAKEAATIANFAAGVVCEHPGIVSIEPMDLFDSVVRNSGAF